MHEYFTTCICRVWCVHIVKYGDFLLWGLWTPSYVDMSVCWPPLTVSHFCNMTTLSWSLNHTLTVSFILFGTFVRWLLLQNWPLIADPVDGQLLERFSCVKGDWLMFGPLRSRKCFVHNNPDAMEIFSYGVIGEGDLFSMYSRPWGGGGGGRGGRGGEGGGGGEGRGGEGEGGKDFFSDLTPHPTVNNESSNTLFDVSKVNAITFFPLHFANENQMWMSTVLRAKNKSDRKVDDLDCCTICTQLT